MKRLFNAIFSTRLSFLLIYLFATRLFAADDEPIYQQISLETLIKNLAEQLPQVWLLATALSYVMGFWFVYWGIITLKKYAEQRSMMSQEGSLKGPLIFIFVGAALIYLPSTLNSGLTTFWQNPNPYGYTEDVNDEWTDLYDACLIIVQLVGLIAFMRGLVILTRLHSGGQHGQFGRALAHIIGGIFLIDLYDTLQMIFETFGLTNILSTS